MELHHLTKYLPTKLRVYFLTSPKLTLNGLGRPRRHVIEDYLLVDQQPVIAAVELRAGRLTTLMPSQRVNSFSAKKLFCDPGSLIGLIAATCCGHAKMFRRFRHRRTALYQRLETRILPRKVG